MSCGKSRGLKLGRTDNITSFNEIIAEATLACAVLTCGADSDEYEKPPPAMLSIDEIYEDFGMIASTAPYIDEETAKYERKLNDKNTEIHSLEKEVKRLETEINRLNNSGQSLDKSEVESSEGNKDVGLNNFEATFYTARCEGCSGITATGIDVRQSIYSGGRRVVAVDPSVIKLGCIVRVTLENGESFEAVAADTGGAIKGARIDILVSTKDEAYRLGRQTAKVEVIK